MKTRRRRFFREDTVAPWVTLLVIVGLWWLGAYALGRSPTTSDVSSYTTAGADVEASTQVAATPRADATAASSRRRDAETAASFERAAPAPADPEFASPSMSPKPPGADDVSHLRDKGVAVPVAGIDASTLRSSYDEARGGGSRRHEAMDILAPRGTPVVAAVEGRIAKLFTSAAGGLTVYQFDPEERFCYYYAHLDSYAPDLKEGENVRRGQVIGTVGTTGNAPPDTPHLHFAIFRLGPEKKWWDGDPLDPFLVLR